MAPIVARILATDDHRQPPARRLRLRYDTGRTHASGSDMLGGDGGALSDPLFGAADRGGGAGGEVVRGWDDGGEAGPAACLAERGARGAGAAEAEGARH